MSDEPNLVERLRERAKSINRDSQDDWLLDEAADMIERLRVENAELANGLDDADEAGGSDHAADWLDPEPDQD